MRYDLPIKTIRLLLKEASERYGASELALKMRVPPSDLRGWLTGRANPPPRIRAFVQQRLFNPDAMPNKAYKCASNIIKFGEMFSGPGGLARGLQDAKLIKDGVQWGYEHSVAFDNDEWACRTYVRNICGGDSSNVHCEDIREADLSLFSGIELLAFGFPCNDFSIVGEQKGVHGKYGPLYSYGVKVLDSQNPKIFIAENVGGLESANEGKTFKIILEALKNAGEGYEITPHLYKFEHYGIPQRRHRIIIVGMRKDLGLRYQVPKPTTEKNQVSVRDALTKPPVDGLPNNELTKQSKIVVRRLSLLPEGENAWYLDEMLSLPDKDLLAAISALPQKSKFDGWTASRIRQEIEEVRLHVVSARMSQIYRRLKASEPSYTITGSGGGGTHGYHWEENRALTNRERARIQTFPDEFVFEGSKEQVRKQIGMAVPVKGMKIIGEAILKTLAGVKYPCVPAKW
jgi:DNA (cytosine-5)-methyltransferase 1